MSDGMTVQLHVWNTYTQEQKETVAATLGIDIGRLEEENTMANDMIDSAQRESPSTESDAIISATVAGVDTDALSAPMLE